MSAHAGDASELVAAALAAADAARARFGEGPPPLWGQAQTPLRQALQRRRWATLALLALAGTLLLWVLNGRTTAEGPAPRKATDWRPAEPPLPDDVSEDSGTITPASATSTASAALSIGRRGRLWQIEAGGASRLDAALELARLSGSAIHGTVEQLAQAPRLHLRWQGSSLAEAWQQVLGSASSYALQCQREACELWVVSTAATSGVPALAMAPAPGAKHAPSGWQGAVAESSWTAVGESSESSISSEHNPSGDAGGQYH